MFIQVLSTPKKKVTIKGKEVPYVDACICITPDGDKQIISTLATYMDDQLIESNVSSIKASTPNDVNLELEVLSDNAITAMTDKIVSLGYNYKVVN